MSIPVSVGLNAVIIAVTQDTPRVLTVSWSTESQSLVESGGVAALPFGELDSESDRTLELALRRWVRQQTGLELGYVEQLYSFGDRYRDPREHVEGRRVLSIAYLALVQEQAVPAGVAASWQDIYAFLPWEDGRKGRSSGVQAAVERASGNSLRAQVCFGLQGSPWDGERVLERYELLYELGQVSESGQPEGWGAAMALDHRRMLATALTRIRGKLRYRPVVFELLPEEFTLLQLQKCVEALAGVPVHKQNFRRLVEQAGLVEGTGRVTKARGRPAELFRFRHEVLRERPAPGVGIPRL